MLDTFSQLAAAFLDWAEKVLRPATVNVYRHYYRRWLLERGDTPLAKICPADLTEFAQTWHACQAIKRLFSWGVDEALVLASNPLARVKPPRKGYRRRILTPAETSRFLRASRPDLRLLLIGFRESFARPQELRLAEWVDLQPDVPGTPLAAALAAGCVSLVLYEFKDCARRQHTEQPRVIVLSPRLCRLLGRLYARTPSRRGAIFRTLDGHNWTANALRCRFRRLRSKLGIRRDKRGETVVPYTWRHTGATMAAAAGVRDRLLADVLGHVETRTTARYCHLQVSHLRDAMNKVWRRDPDSRSQTPGASKNTCSRN